MAQNFIQPGDIMDYTNGGSAITSGSPVVVGSMVGVALVDIANGATGSVQFTGVFRVAKKADDVVTQGAPIYWDAGNEEATVTETDNALMGVAWTAQAGSDTEVDVKLMGNTDAAEAATS